MSNIFDTLEGLSKAKGFIIRDKEYPKDEIMSMFANSSKAKNKLGWKQKWNLRQGLQTTYNYYLNKH